MTNPFAILNAISNPGKEFPRSIEAMFANAVLLITEYEEDAYQYVQAALLAGIKVTGRTRVGGWLSFRAEAQFNIDEMQVFCWMLSHSGKYLYNQVKAALPADLDPVSVMPIFMENWSDWRLGNQDFQTPAAELAVAVVWANFKYSRFDFLLMARKVMQAQGIDSAEVEVNIASRLQEMMSSQGDLSIKAECIKSWLNFSQQDVWSLDTLYAISQQIPAAADDFKRWVASSIETYFTYSKSVSSELADWAAATGITLVAS